MVLTIMNKANGRSGHVLAACLSESCSLNRKSKISALVWGYKMHIQFTPGCLDVLHSMALKFSFLRGWGGVAGSGLPFFKTSRLRISTL